MLATKLHIPRPRSGFVDRPRLAGRLDEGLARGLILVCAPAGFGKTALLADWARRTQRSVAWLSLDAGDNDPGGSGATPPPRWTGCARGSARESPRFWGRRHRDPSRGW